MDRHLRRQSAIAVDQQGGMAEIFRAFSGNPWLQAGTPAGEVSGSLDAGRRAFDAEAGTHWACNLVWRWDRISCDATADAAVQLRTPERQKTHASNAACQPDTANFSRVQRPWQLHSSS